MAIGVTWLWVLLLVPIAAMPSPLTLGPLVAAMAFVGPVWNVVVVGYQYKVIPDHTLGRIKSIVLLVSWGAIPVGSLIAGGLLDRTGPRAAVPALPGLALLAALIASLSPGPRAGSGPRRGIAEPGGRAAGPEPPGCRRSGRRRRELSADQPVGEVCRLDQVLPGRVSRTERDRPVSATVCRCRW
ncbi:hypothetical protein ACGFZB_25110 [Streptomyces cinerochromogenes]|uniref:MFS transporter n=1 Tax=Streptomyces cinerochromogenes TaxID=66422 RepID=A0ABW7B8Z3_9ACTN